MKNIFLSILILSLTVPAHAGVVENSADLSTEIFNENQRVYGNQGTAETAASRTLTNGQAPTSTINPGAKKGKGSQSSGAAANAAMAAMLLAACLAPCPKCAMPLCAMSALAAAQAAHDSNAASESGNVQSITNKDGAPQEASEYEKGKADYLATKKKALDKLKAEGYTMTPSSLISPDGNSTPLSAFNSPASMSAAGVDQKSIDELKKISAEIAKDYGKYSKSGMGVQSAGGGGAADIAQESPMPEEDASKPYDPFALAAAKKKAMMDGKTVMFDGEPIGVAGNNIFEMVHTAYQKRRTGNQFIEMGGNVAPIANRPSGGRIPAAIPGSK